MNKTEDIMLHNACENTLVEKYATLEEWKTKAEALWSLLDDIDTAGDIFKPPHTNYFKYVCNKAGLRFNYMKSDGYEIINVE